MTSDAPQNTGSGVNVGKCPSSELPRMYIHESSPRLACDSTCRLHSSCVSNTPSYLIISNAIARLDICCQWRCYGSTIQIIPPKGVLGQLAQAHRDRAYHTLSQPQNTNLSGHLHRPLCGTRQPNTQCHQRAEGSRSAAGRSAETSRLWKDWDVGEEEGGAEQGVL